MIIIMVNQLIHSQCDISNINNKDYIHKPITNKIKLPKCMCGFGYILYHTYIIIFGGVEWKNGNFKYFDSIYILDLNHWTNGWKEITNCKCPMKSRYRAILMSDDHIYLFATWNKEKIFKCGRMKLSDA